MAFDIVHTFTLGMAYRNLHAKFDVTSFYISEDRRIHTDRQMESAQGTKL